MLEKVASTPKNPALGVLGDVSHFFALEEIAFFAWSSPMRSV
jgi:hypothetical protein